MFNENKILNNKYIKINKYRSKLFSTLLQNFKINKNNMNNTNNTLVTKVLLPVLGVKEKYILDIKKKPDMVNKFKILNEKLTNWLDSFELWSEYIENKKNGYTRIK